MSVTSIDKDFDSLTLTLIADFDATVEEVWDLWADPRKLEKWWGPPGYPATFEKHELAPGGDVTYFMTTPEGQKHHGFWKVTAVDAPSRLEFRDGFADENGSPDEDKPIGTVIVTFSEHEGGARMEMRSMNESREEMQELLDMGAVEGMKAAMNQMDALLAG
jgi:uncharacterized protein YndB with AHSA1/START domain